jgi:ParB-like chromosome segregation protein Spo0J
VAESIRTFGFRQPLVLDEQGMIIVGDTRLKAAKKLGLTVVPVHVANLGGTNGPNQRFGRVAGVTSTSTRLAF